MANGEYSTKFEPDDATSQDEKRRRLVDLLTGVWQFDDIKTIERLDTDTHKGWKSTYRG